jgi:hypothetical protein
MLRAWLSFRSKGQGGCEVTDGSVVIRRTLRALLIPFAAFAVSTAWADDSSSRWSLGMQLGQARSPATSSEPVPLESELSPMSYDMAATVGGSNRFGWRVFTGYRFTNYFAVHVGYAHLGETQSRLVDNSVAFSRMPSFERTSVQTVRGVDVGLQLKAPVTDRVSVDVHGGKYYWHSRTRIDGLWAGGYRDDQRSSRHDADDFFGAGLEVAVMDDLSATVGWTRYQVGNEPVSLWTVGALYRFGFY